MRLHILLLGKAQALEELFGRGLLALVDHVALAAREHLADRVVLDGLELVELLGRARRKRDGQSRFSRGRRRGLSLPWMMLSKVVFPAPFSPSRP